MAFVVSQAADRDTNTATTDSIQAKAADKDTPAAPLNRTRHTTTRIISVILDDRKTGEHCWGRRHRDVGSLSEPRVAADLVVENVLYHRLNTMSRGGWSRSLRIAKNGGP